MRTTSSAVVRQLEGVGIALDQAVDVVDLLHRRLHGVRPGDLDRHVDRPELAAHAPLAQARDVGVQGRIELRGARRAGRSCPCGSGPACGTPRAGRCGRRRAAPRSRILRARSTRAGSGALWTAAPARSPAPQRPRQAPDPERPASRSFASCRLLAKGFDSVGSIREG